MVTLAKPKHLQTQTQNLKSVLPPYHTWALSYLFRSLALLFQLFEMVLCVWFWKCFEKRPSLWQPLQWFLFEYIQRCLSFEKLFQCLKVYFGKCFGIMLWSVFQNSKDVFASFDQVTKSCLPYFTQRSFLHIFNPFDSVVLPLSLVDNLVLGC